ncbi:MAG: hypothetical protein OXB95_05105 [Rhodobacteraceae bacterium]|nr:hypothetical protein [Paracoccaceae bacterium]
MGGHQIDVQLLVDHEDVISLIGGLNDSYYDSAFKFFFKAILLIQRFLEAFGMEPFHDHLSIHHHNPFLQAFRMEKRLNVQETVTLESSPERPSLSEGCFCEVHRESNLITERAVACTNDQSCVDHHSILITANADNSDSCALSIFSNGNFQLPNLCGKRATMRTIEGGFISGRRDMFHVIANEH